MLQPAATAFLLWLLQAKAKVESARVNTKPPWQMRWPLRCRGVTTMRITARPGSQAVIHIHDRAMFRLLMREGAASTPADAAFGTPEMSRVVGRLAATLPPVAVLVMAGHEDGLIAYAPDPRSARDALWDVYARSRRE